MAQNNHTITELHNGKPAVAHCDLNSGNELKSLWIEIPGHCHLFCSYCFASTKKHCVEQQEGNLTDNEYKKLLEDFKNAGGKFLGIPGRGEPFHPENIDLVKKIITWAQEFGLITTIFTTGDTIFFPPSNTESKNNLNTDQTPNNDLIDFLIDKDVVLLIKYNSKNKDIQDKIVSTSGYTELREKAIELLIQKREENKDKWKLKLGIVTSILPDNKDEIESLYDEFHTQKGFIFDCDTILPRGRGKCYHDKYYDRADGLTHEQLKDIFCKLKKKGATLTCQGGTYVGVACDRIKHHLYVSLKGEVYPCIGCFENPNFTDNDGKSPFFLGNIKEQDVTLLGLWNNDFRKRLRENTREAFTGVCYNCHNFKDETCYSCLGRCTKKIITDKIETRGCTNHRPILTPWVNSAVDYLRTILAFPNTKNLLGHKEKGLEALWKPNQNLAFKLHQLDSTEQKDELQKIIDALDAHNSTHYNPDDTHKKTPVDRFSRQKHYKYSDLFFPLNKVWDFVKEPPINHENFTEEKQQIKLENEFSKSFLSNVFLPSLRILLENHYAEDKSSVICNIMFYDNIKSQYFYRTISKGEKAESTIEFDKSLILFRWAENFKDGNYFGEKSKGVFFNVSEVFRNSLYREYELILKKSEHSETNGNKFNLSCFFEDKEDTKFITEKIDLLNTYIQNQLATKEWDSDDNEDSIKKILNKKIFSELETIETKKLSTFFEELNKQLYSIKDNCDVVNSISTNTLKCINSFIQENKKQGSEISELLSLSDIQTFVNNKENEKILGVSINFLKLFASNNFIPTINYLVFLGYLHKYLNINYYLLEHSKSFKTPEGNPDLGYEDIIDPSGILICSENRISRDFKSELTLLLSTIFQPIDEFYFDKTIRINDKPIGKTIVYNHTIEDIAPHLEYTIAEVDFLIRNNEYGSTLDSNKVTELRKLKDREKDVFNIFNTLLENNLKDTNRWRGKTLYELINIVITYCNYMRDEKNPIKKIDPNRSTNILEKELEVFTIFYNLLINANEASFFKYTVKLDSKIEDNNLIINITNYGILLNEEIINFVNGEGKKFTGLGVIKRLIKSLDWKISVQNEIPEGQENDNAVIANETFNFGNIIFKITIPIK